MPSPRTHRPASRSIEAPTGIRIGLEIHQRLDTGKLFCHCRYDARMADENEVPQAEFHRRLRAVAGELGQVDPAAIFENRRDRLFYYQSPLPFSCLIEEDDQPPSEINREALTTAFKVALALHATPVDEVHVMRKAVVDGSAVSGFQRTALVALDGFVETSRGRVRIPTITLEEESSAIVEHQAAEGSVTYRLDRLGIPLVEIASDSGILDGEHAREVAKTVGELLRSIGGVQRGIGTIRQDINISVPQGARVEIKGVQELASLKALVENETARQKLLAEIRGEFNKRGRPPVEPEGIKSVTHVFKNSACPFIAKAVADGVPVMAVKLPLMGGLLSRELFKHQRLGTELSDYARAASGLAGIIHSDEELSKYPITASESAGVRGELGCGAHDAWLVCVGEEAKAVRALQAAFERGRTCWEGVPKESRKAEGERSRFMRPLPGSARMYPETDVPPISIETKWLKELSKQLPKPMGEQLAELTGLGLNEQTARQLLDSGERRLFEFLREASKADAQDVAFLLLQDRVQLSREGIPVSNIPEESLAEILSLRAKGGITRAAVPLVLKELARSPKKKVAEIIANNTWSAFSDAELKALIKPHASEPAEKTFGTLIRGHRLRADPARLRTLLGIG